MQQLVELADGDVSARRSSILTRCPAHGAGKNVGFAASLSLQ
jgi:hypothetical protein